MFSAGALGRELADVVQRALSKAGSPVSGPIEAHYAVIRLPGPYQPEAEELILTAAAKLARA